MMLVSNPYSSRFEFAIALPLEACWDITDHFWRQYRVVHEENWLSFAGWRLQAKQLQCLQEVFQKTGGRAVCFSWQRRLFEDLEFRKFQGFQIFPYISVLLFWVPLLPDQWFLWKGCNFTSTDIQPLIGIKFCICFSTFLSLTDTRGKRIFRNYHKRSQGFSLFLELIFQDWSLQVYLL